MEKSNVMNGTCYDNRTPIEVIKVLEYSRINRIRIVLDYGNTETGESWNEIYDVTGTVGRSCGTVKIPILLYNSRSIGGSGILDHCIIGIRESKGKKVLYQLKK